MLVVTACKKNTMINEKYGLACPDTLVTTPTITNTITDKISLSTNVFGKYFLRSLVFLLSSLNVRLANQKSTINTKNIT